MDETLGYKAYRAAMDTGDLLLFSGHGPVPWLIKKITKSDVNHAAYVMRIREYMRDRVMQIGAVGGGFVLSPLSEVLEHYDGTVYWLQLNPEFRKLRLNIGCEALKLSGTKYDFGSLFKNVLGRVNANAARLFCSEAVQIIGERAGLPVPVYFDGIAARPGDLELFYWWGGRHMIKGDV